MPAQRHEALRVIAAYKFLKMAGLLVVAVAAFGLVREARLIALADWVMQLPYHLGHRFLVLGINHLLDFGPRQFIAIGVAACIYAAVFGIEGWGLWRGRRWAEWLTVIVTASLIPFELWEIHHRFTWLKLLALMINIAVVWYLAYLLRRKE